MNENIITDKILESCNDVFADIVNVLLFNGEPKISPEELIDQKPCDAHKECCFHRLTVKRWMKQNIHIAIISLDNQTVPTNDMPMRVFGYESAEYAAQEAGGHKHCPIVTLVLYYGTEKRWDKARSLSEVIDGSEKLKPFFQDYRMNLFEVAYLEPDVVKKFKSDFRVVANYFVELRKIDEYMKNVEGVNHGSAVRRFLERMALPTIPDC